MPKREIGFVWLLLSAAGYAFLPIFARSIYIHSDLQPTDIALWRFIFATPLIWLFIFLREQMSADRGSVRQANYPVLRMMSLGILYAGAALSAFAGLELIPASIYVVLFFTYPAMVALISLLLGTRLPLSAWIALVMTLVGIVLTVPEVGSLQEGSIAGVFIALLNALFVAVYFTLVGRFTRGSSSVGRGSAYVITGTLIVLLLASPVLGLNMPPNLTTWLLLIGLASVSTTMPIFLAMIGIRLVGAARAAIITTIEPVLAMVLAMILLGEVVLGVQWLGAAFIIGGVLLLEVRPMLARRRTVEQPMS